MLMIEVRNLTLEPVEVRSVHAGYRYTNPLTEATFGKGAPELPLPDLAGDHRPPCVLAAGGSFIWTASMDQLVEVLAEKQLTLGPHSPYVHSYRIEADYVRGIRPGYTTVKIRNVVANWTFRRLAIVIQDDRDDLYKTKVRWQPPGGAPHNPRNPSPSRA